MAPGSVVQALVEPGVALVEPGSAAEAACSVLKAYSETYPELSEASCAFLCDTGDAAEVIPAPAYCC